MVAVRGRFTWSVLFGVIVQYSVRVDVKAGRGRVVDRMGASSIRGPDGREKIIHLIWNEMH